MAVQFESSINKYNFVRNSFDSGKKNLFLEFNGVNILCDIHGVRGPNGAKHSLARLNANGK